MEARLSFITLGVADLARATAFYRDVLALPQIAMPEGAGVAFFELGKTWLSLFPRSELAQDAGVADSPPAAFPGFSLAHNVRERLDVDALLAEVASRGGEIVKPAADAFWGGRSGYFRDPDGFLWEVAWNPQFPHV
ncbi:VOC family protein [Vogesella oryzae]|uniref:VOC family protein n=1 Tax=Vogesella oryzae TaxID=1735285 RepID=UPI0015834430|nr:VOC family protein [Vogesella oryzae]